MNLNKLFLIASSFLLFLLNDFETLKQSNTMMTYENDEDNDDDRDNPMKLEQLKLSLLNRL